ncbi:MAG TPA: hydrogenase maturation nickel metallochaperone HypA [Selenomonadales bacterium]|nr:hydrogenase maturation nickel metallochaperone HypA [Selenomonadales bacterium]
MHEMAIAQGILEIVADAAANNGAGKVSRIKLQIGQLTAIEPDALRFCFAAMAAGTMAERAELEIEIMPLICRCQDCSRSFAVEAFRLVCPDCGSHRTEITSGRELRVEHLEVE